MACSSCWPSSSRRASWAARLARYVSSSGSTWEVRTGTRSALHVVFRVLGAHDVLLDLAGGGLGQLVDEDDRLGHLEAGDAGLQRRDQPGGVDRLAGPGDNERS